MFLPRELGEQGALRVAAMADNPIRSRRKDKATSRIQGWIRDNYGETGTSPANAKKIAELHDENLRRFREWLPRMRRPTRVG
jgi:hypothetical protein